MAGRRPKVCAALGPGPAAALSSARRRAVRDGDRQVDTAHLLHGLVESDPAVREALGGTARLTRVLGYLAQRSIGYGLRWRRTVEGAAGAAGTVEEALAAAPAGVLGWSPAAAAALEDALRRARGGARVEGVDLLDALLADPCCRAVEVLRRTGAVPVAAPVSASVPAAVGTEAQDAGGSSPQLCQGRSR
ncbi:Clp protease N-terminal domain-containing protein [Streptomyces pini]|uniref:Clp amino terminal domain-containing protein, pathogenicity island component n=1 Tax=Streptomyces pini TaxID=1520580 RepID=A0A1I3X4S9_9ACTN|nr:Clp protease N-terminal domain-containing protein [Streptomyces pini]SFK14564.1 Clp amino terminal domain-containing protein, pathogenicity island component [Streptomyces pini]